MINRRIAGAATCALALLLSACGTTASKPPSYENSFLRPPLEVPPDLVMPDSEGNLTIPQPPGPGGTVAKPDNGTLALQPLLPSFSGMQIAQDGCERWLVIQATPEQVWDLVQRFVKDRNLAIRQQSRRLGIIDTAWHDTEPFAAKAHDDVPEILGARATYRFRIEPGAQAGNTELYISRRSVNEVLAGRTTAWEAAPPSPEAEAAMLRTFMVFAGVSQQQAATQIQGGTTAYQTALVTDAQGNLLLRFHDTIDNGWRRTGLALDRIGWLVKDRDRSKWTYRVQQANSSGKPGFFKRLFSSSAVSVGPVYLVVLNPTSDGWVEARMQLKNGTPAPKADAEPFLKQLYTQMK